MIEVEATNRQGLCFRAKVIGSPGPSAKVHLFLLGSKPQWLKTCFLDDYPHGDLAGGHDRNPLCSNPENPIIIPWKKLEDALEKEIARCREVEPEPK